VRQMVAVGLWIPGAVTQPASGDLSAIAKLSSSKALVDEKSTRRSAHMCEHIDVVSCTHRLLLQAAPKLPM